MRDDVCFEKENVTAILCSIQPRIWTTRMSMPKATIKKNDLFIRHRNNRIEIVPCNDFFAIFASELALIKLFKDFKFLQKSINV